MFLQQAILHDTKAVGARLMTHPQNYRVYGIPWTRAPYTPIYYLVESDDSPCVPAGEEIDMQFMEPDAVFASTLVAGPERAALAAALEVHDGF